MNIEKSCSIQLLDEKNIIWSSTLRVGCSVIRDKNRLEILDENKKSVLNTELKSTVKILLDGKELREKSK